MLPQPSRLASKSCVFARAVRILALWLWKRCGAPRKAEPGRDGIGCAAAPGLACSEAVRRRKGLLAAKYRGRKRLSLHFFRKNFTDTRRHNLSPLFQGYQGAPQQQQPEAQGASKAPFPASSAPFCIIEVSAGVKYVGVIRRPTFASTYHHFDF